MTSLSAWFRLFRPWNALIAGAAVWLGWAGLRLQPEWQLALWGSLSMLLLVAGGNADNDAVDAVTDRVNRPHRPVAAGTVSRRAAFTAAFLLYGAGVLLAWIGSPIHGAVAAGMALLLVAYNRVLKGLPLSGNLAVALLCGLAVYFVELPLLIDFPLTAHDSLPAALFALLATFARELVKDAEDVAGDRAAGLRTFAVARGTGAARKLAFAVVVILLLLLPVPLFAFAHGAYGWPYAAAVVLLTGPVLVPLLGELSREEANLARAQKLLKALMVAGMVALLAGAITR
jgi:geranylgeranylglycerol-phosphate geranylgeranyltransferase